MNGNQQLKALNYAILYLGSEIQGIKEGLEKVTDPLTKPLLEKRLAELEVDYDMFIKISESFN